MVRFFGGDFFQNDFVVFFARSVESSRSSRKIPTLWPGTLANSASVVLFYKQQLFWGRSCVFAFVGDEFLGFGLRDPMASQQLTCLKVGQFLLCVFCVDICCTSAISLSSSATCDVAVMAIPQASTPLDQPFMVGLGFLPVPTKLVAQIISGKYVKSPVNTSTSDLPTVNLEL